MGSEVLLEQVQLKCHECTNMGKVKELKLWWQLYVTSLPEWDVRDIRPLDFCWTECTRVGAKVTTPFFSQKVSTIAVTVKLTYMMDTSFTHFGLFFHKVSLIINTLFTTFCETLYARHVKFFAEASELFMYTVSASHPQNGVLGFHSSGGQKMVVTGCKIRTVGKMRTWFIFLFGWTLQISCCNCFSVCTFCSEL